MKKIAFCLLFAVAFAASAFAQQSATVKDSCLLKGKVELVTIGADVKVEVVTLGADIHVEFVTAGSSWCGKAELVDLGADIKVEIVDLGADFKIEIVDWDGSKERFFKEYERVYGKPFEFRN